MKLKDKILIEEFEEALEQINESGWSALPKGWTKASVMSFAKNLTGKSGDEHGFFDACVSKIGKHVSNPEAFCATVKDLVYGSTYWRGKGKSKEDIKSGVKKHKNVKTPKATKGKKEEK
jgi:hypothetical protein